MEFTHPYDFAVLKFCIVITVLVKRFSIVSKEMRRRREKKESFFQQLAAVVAFYVLPGY